MRQRAGQLNPLVLMKMNRRRMIEYFAILLTVLNFCSASSVPDKCFSISKLFPLNQTLMQSGLIISDLNLLLGSRFNEDMRLSAVDYCVGRQDQRLRHF